MEKAKLTYLIKARATLVTESCYIFGTVIAVDDSCTQVVDAQIIERPAFHDVYKEAFKKEITWLLINNMKIWDAYVEPSSFDYKYSVSSENIIQKATNEHPF